MDPAATLPIEMICWIIIGFIQSNLALNLVEEPGGAFVLEWRLGPPKHRRLDDRQGARQKKTEVLERALERAQHNLFLLGIDWRPSGSLHFWRLSLDVAEFTTGLSCRCRVPTSPIT